jgi:hypothetical protein
MAQLDVLRTVRMIGTGAGIRAGVLYENKAIIMPLQWGEYPPSQAQRIF